MEFFVISLLFIVDVVSSASISLRGVENATINTITNLIHRGNESSGGGESQYTCNVCIDENLVIGTPNLPILTFESSALLTCSSLQIAAENDDLNEKECQDLQAIAKRCKCSSREIKTLSENPDRSQTIIPSDHPSFTINSSSILNITNNTISSATSNNTTETEENINKREELISTILVNIFLFFLVLGLSATVPVKQLKHQITNKRALITGVCMQFIIMPFMGFLSVLIFKNVSDNFTKAMGLTLLVVTSSPGGAYSNWFCSLYNADLALSVAMTAFSTLLSIGMLPANLVIYTHLAYGNQDDGADGIVEALDFKTLFLSLGIVMVALIVGLYASYLFESKTFMTWANRGSSLSGIGLVVVSGMLSSTGTEVSFFNQDWMFYTGVAFPCLVGLSLANFCSRSLARLKKTECVSISIECGYQNTSIAMSVAVTMFSDPKIQADALAVPIFYTFVQTMAVLSFGTFAWKFGWTKAPSNERLCVVLAKNYQLDDTNEVNDSDISGKELAIDQKSTESSMAKSCGVEEMKICDEEQPTGESNK